MTISTHASPEVVASRQTRLIAFLVAGEAFVLDIMAIDQIVQWQGSTPIPRAPDFVEGVVVLRGEVVPIVDLRKRLFDRPAESDLHPLILVTRTPRGTIGLKVDEVARILTVDLGTIMPPPPLIRGLDGDWLVGVIEQKDRIYLLLDVDSILTSAERKEVDEAVAEVVQSDDPLPL